LDEDIAASALGAALARPNNQYAILVSEHEGEYIVSFTSEIVDFNDGKCWVECQLLNKDDNSLMVDMGWKLKRRASDGAWLVNGIDWQDFRDAYRPGIGREEWMYVYC